jgi:hypothetical protein
MANIFKNKNFWFSLAHIATAAGSAAIAISFPAAVPAIIPLQALINGIIPSPLNTAIQTLSQPLQAAPMLPTHIPIPDPTKIDMGKTGMVGLMGTGTQPIGLTVGDEMKMKDKIS